MARDFQKAERRLKKDEKYKLLSYATSSESVEMTDGTDLQTKMNSVDKSISDEVTRAKGAESTLTTNLNSEISRAKSAESTLTTNLNNEISRAKGAETTNANAISSETTRATAKENEIANNLSSHTSNTSNPHSVTKAQVGLGNVENKSSATIRGEITKSNVTTALGYTPYTPNEVDNKFSALETNIDWKESVATYNDITTTYPNPVDGWTVNVKDTDYTYRYNGTSWVAISANAIPKATNSVDGLLSKEDHINYEDANSKKHTHSNKSVLDGISSTNISNWNAAKTHADSAHAPSNAQANQNAFSNIAIGSTTIAADTTTDTLTLTGSNVTLTPDATNDKVTIGITKDNVINALGYTPSSASVATSSNLGLVKSGTDITVDSSGNVSVNDDSHNHTQIKYCANISSDDAINNFLEAETFKTAVWTSTSSPGVSNGIILSGGYVNDTYGYQLAIDDDPTYYMALRQKSGNGWSSWKQIPMGDGTGASGTWNINISGNATTATSAGNADTLDGNHASAFASSSHTHNYAGSSSAGGSANSAVSVVDYGDTSKTIKIGFAGAGATTDNLAYIAGYLSGGTQIKDVNKDTLKSWLGLGSAAYTSSDAYAASSHTHNYAGSSSAGGSATSAVKLDSSAGSATQPVYFSSGKPAACSYSVRPIDSTYTSKLTNASTTSFSQEGAYNLYTALNSKLVKNTTVSVNCTSTVSNRSPFTYCGTSSQINGTILSVTPIVSNGNWTVVPNITANKNSFYLFANGSGAITCSVIYI